MIYTPDNKLLRIGGRTLLADGVLYFNYTCSYIDFEFVGTKAHAVLKTDLCPSEEMFRAWVGVFIDDKFSAKYPLNEKETIIPLYEGEKKQVRIRIMKLSEAAFAKCGLVSLDIDGELVPLTNKLSERRIEFVGDSITCGYGIDGVYEKDVFSTATENPLKGYAYLTAQKCKADFQYISWSGMGVYSSYAEESAAEPNQWWLFKDIYPYTDSGVENTLGKEGHENHTKYDFSYKPQVTVFAEGTNDHSWTRFHPESCEEFEKEYGHILDLIREGYPDTFIVCTYGVMEDLLKDNIARQIEEFKKRHDDRIIFVPFEKQDEANDGVAVDWHPSAVTHAKMAEKMAEVINGIFEKMGL